MLRRALVALAIGLFGFLALMGGSAAARAATACLQPCDGQGAVVGSGPSQPATDLCIRDAGCGGGAALTSGAGVAALVAVGTSAVVLGLLVRRRKPGAVRLPLGRVLAGGLFRPPQALLGI